MLKFFFCSIAGSLLLYSRMALVTLGEKKGTKIGGAANQILERLHHKTVHLLSGALLCTEGTNVSSKDSVQQEIR